MPAPTDPGRLPRPVSRSSSRRHFLGGIAALAASLPLIAECRGQAAAMRVPDFRRPGDADDTAAALRAMQQGSILYFPAGGGSAPDGAYRLNALPLRSDVTLYGDSDRSVLRTTPAAMAALSIVSKTSTDPLTRITIRNLRIEGLVASTGFREHWNLISVSGVDGLNIEGVQFVGFAGDGLYLGAEFGWPVRSPRIIRNVVVRDCLFDGVNNDNRNGISVTGGFGILIDQCRFVRCTRPNMPGPIDFEPDAFAFYRLENLRVTNCSFEQCGGNVGQIAVTVPAVASPPRSILIANNRFRTYRGTGGDIAVSINREPTAALPSMDCVIENNDGDGGYGGFQIFSAKGVTIRGNQWRNYASRSFLGFTLPDAGVSDVTVSDRFDHCGWREGIALALYKGTDVTLSNNLFTGTGNGRPGSAPLYLGKGRIRGLSVVANDWRNNPQAVGLVTVENGADYRPATTRIESNLLPPGGRLAL